MEERHYNRLIEILSKEGMGEFKKEREKLMNTTTSDAAALNPEMLPYRTLEEYKAQTGKRFRRTRHQTERGITREEAFQEFLVNKFGTNTEN